MAMAIAELNKFLDEEREKREKLFQENLKLQFEIESLRAVDHVTVSEDIVSEIIKDNSGIVKAETFDCLGNNGNPDPCSQQKYNQHENKTEKNNRKISLQRKRRGESPKASKETRPAMMVILHRQHKKLANHRLVMQRSNPRFQPLITASIAATIIESVESMNLEI